MNWFRRACARIYDGSTVIGWRMARWPWENAEFWSRLRRIGALGFLAWGTWRLTGAYPRFTAVLIAAWLVAAYRAAGERPVEIEPGGDEDDGEAGSDGPPQTPRKASPDEIRAWMLPRIRGLIGTENGVFLEDLLADLIADGHLPAGYRPTKLRGELEAAGIPVRDQVHIGRANRVGVHRADIPDAGLADATPPPSPDDTAA